MPGRWRKVFKLDPQQIIYISHIPEPERGIWLRYVTQIYGNFKILSTLQLQNCPELV